MTRIPIAAAKTAIEEHSKIFRPELVSNPEWNAIVSHWLQDIASIPVFGTTDDRDTWLSVLSSLTNGLDDANDAPEISFKGIPFPPTHLPDFRFIDLFAGIGGFRLALQSLAGKCVFSSEWDRAAKETYSANYGEVPFGDVRQFTNENLSREEIMTLIPDHNVLAAGFPCQPFSLAGVSARQALGKATGFACETQGTCFWDIVRIADVKRPDVLILENVKNLRSHDKGQTMKLIRKTIEDDLGYSFAERIIDAKTLVPQHRERCYMVCFKNSQIKFEFPDFSGVPLAFESILESDTSKVSDYTISDRLWQGHQLRTRRNVARGTGFTAYLADPKRPSNTIVARYGKDGKECLVPQGPGENPRMLTPSECARLQGFPEGFIIPKARTPAYKQFGNSVAVPVVRRIAEAALVQLKAHDSNKLLADTAGSRN